MADPTTEIAAHRFVTGLAPEYVERVVDAVREERSWSADQTIFTSGTPADEVYLLLEGDAAVEVHAPGSGARIIQTLRGGEMLGWSWLLPPHRWTFDARALTPTRAAVLDGPGIRAASVDDPTFGFEVVTRVAGAMADRLQSTRLQLLDLYAHRT